MAASSVDENDDLEAFFDAVSAVEPHIDVEEPPTKKQKTITIRPKGIVVASSGSAIVSVDHSTNEGTGSAVTNTNTTRPEFLGIPPPPPPLPPPSLPLTANESNQPLQAHKRSAAGTTWTDATLSDWPENDFRIFVGNLSKDVTDPELYEHFSKYKSLAMVKIVKDAKTGLSKGFGFCSLLDPLECARAIREMDQTWLSSRPIRIKRSDWKERELREVQKKNNMKKKQGKRFM